MAPQVVHTGILDLITQSGPVGKSVLLLLLFVSTLSWAIIIMKWRTLGAAARENERFLDVFWHSKSIDEIFGKADKFNRSPVAAVFKSGFKELKKLSVGDSGGMEPGAVDNITRSLNRASSNE